MSANFGHVAFAQVRQLLANVNKKNLKATSGEISQLVDVYGHDVQVFILRTLLSHMDLKNPKASQDQIRLQLLSQEFVNVFGRSNCISVICQSFEGVTSAEEICFSFCKILKLTSSQQIVFGFSLVHALDVNIRNQGLKFLKLKLGEMNSVTLNTIPESVLWSLWCFLRSNSAFISERDAMMKLLSNVNIDIIADVMSIPLIRSDVRDADTFCEFETEDDGFVCAHETDCSQLAEMMEDFGFICTQSHDFLKDVLSTCEVNEPCISHAVAMMARTCSSQRNSSFQFILGEESNSFSRTWNLQVFVDSVSSCAPKLDWAHVIRSLDNRSLGKIDVCGLNLILEVFKRATSSAFPVEFAFGRWKFPSSQLSVLKALIGAELLQSELLNLPRRVPCPSPVWGSLDVLETLLQLSDNVGYEEVAELFRPSLSQYPDALLLALAECQPCWCSLYHDLVSNLIGMIIFASPLDATKTLHSLWALNKGLIVQALIDAYRTNPSVENVKRILEIIQLIGSHALLEMLSCKVDFGFVFDVAVAAAQIRALPLANWLARAIADEGDEFGLRCIGFLKERVFSRTSSALGRQSIPADAISTFLQSLQSCKNGVVVYEAGKLMKEAQGRLVGGAPPPVQGGSNPVSAAPTPANGVSNGGSTVESSEGAPAQVAAQPNQTLFPPDIEEEANSHFQRIYTSEMQIDGVIQMLKGFKLSQNQREQEVFACMIHNLFDEYRFFPRYPERELLITGKLFGSLIQHQLVSSITLGIALRYVLEALRKPLRSSMFKFGMCALEQFKSRLVEWPQYCHHILQIQHIRSSHEELIDYIQRALSGGRAIPDALPLASAAVPSQVLASQTSTYLGVSPDTLMATAPQISQPMVQTQPLHSSAQAQAYGAFGMQQPPTASSAYSGFSQGFGQDPHHQLPSNLQNFASDSSGLGPGSQDQASQALDMRNAAVQQTLSVVSGASAFGATTNVDLLLQRAKQVVQPDSGLMDKVHFIFNNLSNTNLDQKEKDLVSALNETHLPWLCQYIVIKRAAQEQNYHSLYLQFCDRLDKKPNFAQLMKGVITCTIDNIKTLLADDKITSSSSVRSLLKNLGSWLGSLTLQKNKPILQKDLDFKQLIVDAYDKGRLIAVIPFIAKVIDSCANSRIFRPPNPWTMMVLGLLAELHPMSDLKLNIKFEVEVLCKSLSKELKDIKPSNVFKNRPSVKDGNADWTSRDASSDLSLKPLPQVPDPRLVEAADRLTARAGNLMAAGIQSTGMDSNAMMDQSGSMSIQGQQPVPETMQNIPNIAQYITINQNIPVFQQYPQLRAHVMSAITLAIKEIISPVVERSVTIARITTQELILKDFAFESDETQMKTAAHMMVQNLAGSLALVTCKEPLRHSMCNQLRTMLQKMQVPNLEASALEAAAQQVAFENLDLGCNLIEKAATDKAIREIDHALDSALSQRRKPGTPLYDNLILMQNWLRFLPEVLRPKTGGLMPHQKRVYEDFARLPRERMAQMAGVAQSAASADAGLRAMNEGGQSAGGMQLQVQIPNLDLRMVVEKCSIFMSKAEEIISMSQIAASPLASLPQGHDLFQLIVQARQFILSVGSLREDLALAYTQKLFRRLYDGTKFGICQLGIDWILASLQTLNEITKRVSKEISLCMAYADNDRKLNRDLTIGLVQCHLLSLNSPDYVKEIVKSMESGRNTMAVHTVLQVIQHCVLDKRVVSAMDSSALLEVLHKIAMSKGPLAKNENIVKILEDVHNLSRSAMLVADERKTMASGVMAGKFREQPDPPHLRSAIFAKMQEWVDNVYICQSSNPHTLFLHSRSFLSSILQLGWLKGDELTDRFFRLAIEWSVDKVQLSSGSDTPREGYFSVDAFTRLVKVLFTSYESWAPSTVLTRIQLLNKILAAVIKVLRGQYAERKAQFNQKPFHRLLLRLLQDDTQGSWALGISETRLRQGEDEVQPLVLAMADTLFALQPRLVPGFSFAWLELVSHKQVMPALVKAKSKGWAPFQRLLMGLLKYLEPYLRTAELHDSTKMLYKGTLRVLLVLLHDFPEFLCEYHVSFCDAIPPSCIQLRNLILSAFPRNMQLPDPLCPGLKVDLLPEMSKPPAMSSNFTTHLINHATLKADLDNYLKGRVGGIAFLSELPLQLILTNPIDVATSGGRYNLPLLNALVLHTAAYAISQGHGQTGKTPLSSSSSMDIFLKLARDLDTEGRYLLLNSVANQLRYPNSHTHFFSCVLLFIFQSSADKEIVREQVTRVLIERLIVNKPHPWGLLITFIELIKNPQYEFWRHEFVRSSKEIEQLFLSVARFCGASASPVATAEGTPARDVAAT